MAAFDVGFSGNPLNRLSEGRDDLAAITSMAANRSAKAVAFVRSMPILRFDNGRATALHPLAQARNFDTTTVEVLLGRDAIGPVFALLLPDDAAREEEDTGSGDRRCILPGRPDLQIRDLRTLARKNLLVRSECAILAQAKSILHFHATHAFCARCGAPSQPVHAGWRRDCPACGAMHFPRTDPVAIMMVTSRDHCLLGRQKSFPPQMYSCLAGYLEGGETLEEAVRREVMEEAGITVGAVTYVASQPWPFPSTLMLGCRAEALSHEITMDAVELEDCRWFSRAEARAMIEESHAEGFFAPSKFAIARTLLDQWLTED